MKEEKCIIFLQYVIFRNHENAMILNISRLKEMYRNVTMLNILKTVRPMVNMKSVNHKMLHEQFVTS